MVLKLGFACLAILSASQTLAFAPAGCIQDHKAASQLQISQKRTTTALSLSNQKSPANDVAALTLAGMVFASTFGSITAPQPADAVDISSGAIVIQTSQKEGQSLLNTELDAKSILTTLFKNRKELTSSGKKIVNYVNDELNTPAWLELKKEFLQIEDDVAPEVKVLPPQDWKQTVKDVTKGKLNFIVNGEIVNVAVEPSFGEKEDEIIIRATGLKNVPLPELSEPQAVVVKSRIQEQFDEFYFFWNSPVPVPYLEENGIKIDNGAAIIVGGTTSIAGIYAASYSYYLNEIATVEKKSQEAKEKRLALKKKKDEAAAKKKAETAPPAKKEVAEAKDAVETKKVPEKVVKTETKAVPENPQKSLAEEEAEKAARDAIKEAATVAMVKESKADDQTEDSANDKPTEVKAPVRSKAKAVGPKKKRRKWYKLWLFR